MKRTIPICLVLLAALLLPIGGAAALSQDALDLRDEVSYTSSESSLSSLLTELLGETLSPVESDYLDNATGLSFRLHEAIPPDSVSTSAQESGLAVRARIYRYETAAGVTVTFLPRTALLGTHATALNQTEDGDYVGVLVGAKAADVTLLTVNYEAAISLSGSTCTALARLAYTAGKEALATLTFYRTEYAAWQTAAAAYALFCEEQSAYLRDREEYERYLTALAAYESAKADYDAYLAAKAAYEEAYAAYSDYLLQREEYLRAYEEYTDRMAALFEGQEALREYLVYTATLRACHAKLAPMQYITDPVGHLSATVQGETVATVIKNKTALIAAGCNAADIDACAGATETLRRLLPLYEALTEDSERYAFYAAHYEELLTAVSSLQKSLYALLGNSIVQAELDNKGKLERFIQFLGQLYISRALLDDELTLDEGWYVKVVLAHRKKTYSLTEALDGITPLPSDANTNDPRGLAYPSKPSTALPDGEALPEEPIAPLPLTRPIEPERVSAPGEKPTEVSKPIPPTPVEPAGEEPICTVTDPWALRLAEAVEGGVLVLRPVLSDTTLTRRSTLRKYISPSGRAIVNFYNYDGRSLLGYTEADENQNAAYRGQTPTRPADGQYEYRFLGWVDQNGEQVSLTEITADTAVYAAYATEALHYTVTWVIGDRTETARYEYGQTPLPPQDTTRPSDALYHYRFLGWSETVAPVTGDVTYTARYRAEKRSYTVSFVMQDKTVTETAEAGLLPTLPTPTPYLRSGNELLTFTGWSETPTAALSDKTYVALYSRAALVFDRVSGTAAAVQGGTDGYTVMATRSMTISRLLTLAANEGASLRFLAGNVTLYLPPVTVRELAESGAAALELRSLSPGAGGMLFRVSVIFSDASGRALTALPSGMLLRFSYTTADGHYGEIYRETDKGSVICPTSAADGLLSAGVTENGIYALCERFPVSISGGTGGTVSASGYTVAAGDRVLLSPLPTSGYHLTSIRVIRTDTGEEIPLTDGGFLMPHAPICIEAVFSRERYTVTFISEGCVLSEETYFLGDTLKLPSAPTHSDPQNYVFAAWSPLPLDTVTESAVYEAVFHARGNAADFSSQNDNNRFLTTYLPILLGVLLLGGTLFFLLRRRKRRTKK